MMLPGTPHQPIKPSVGPQVVVLVEALQTGKARTCLKTCLFLSERSAILSSVKEFQCSHLATDNG